VKGGPRGGPPGPVWSLMWLSGQTARRSWGASSCRHSSRSTSKCPGSAGPAFADQGFLLSHSSVQAQVRLSFLPVQLGRCSYC